MVSEAHDQVNIHSYEHHATISLFIIMDNLTKLKSRYIPMTEDFIPDQIPEPETPLSTNTPSEPNRVPLKILVISTPKVVNNTIHTFYRLGYAEVSEWSKLQPTQTPGEVMSILSRRVRID
jgi:hypothetical protein